MKIMWELYSNINDISINKNFKIFFDEKLIEDNCQKAIENNTMIVNINYENVDDLEAAHDIWVNVLEEKIVLSDGQKIKEKESYFGYPTLVNYVPSETMDAFIKKFSNKQIILIEKKKIDFTPFI